MLYRIVEGLQFRRRERDYVVVERLADRTLIISDVTSGARSALAESSFVDEVARGEVLFSPPGAPVGTRAAPMPIRYSEKVLAEVARRLEYVRALDDVASRGIRASVIADVSRRIADPSPPAPITARRWLGAYRRSGRDPTSLAPNFGRRGRRAHVRTRLDEIVDDAIARFYLTRARPTIKATIDLANARVDRINAELEPEDRVPHVTYSALWRRIAALAPYDVMRAREGARRAGREYRAYGARPRPRRPLERVEIDHTPLDVLVDDAATDMRIGRPWLSAAVDLASRAVTGFFITFSAPCAQSVALCLRHTILPKSYLVTTYPSLGHSWDVFGIPETIIVDNGREFHSRHLEDACLRLGILIEYAPIATPEYKGVVERFFGSLNRAVFGAGDRPGDRRKGGNRQPALPIIDFDRLVEVIHTWVVDVYHYSPHLGISDTPAAAWNAASLEAPPCLVDATTNVDLLLNPRVTRTLNRSGVSLHGLRYNSPELGRLRKSRRGLEHVECVYDPLNLSRILVVDPASDAPVEALAVNIEYARGLTLYAHRVIRQEVRAELRAKVDETALCAARREIWDAVHAAPNSTVAKRAARIAGINQNSVLPQTSLAGSSATEALVGTTVETSVPVSDTSPSGAPNALWVPEGSGADDFPTVRHVARRGDRS